MSDCEREIRELLQNVESEREVEAVHEGVSAENVEERGDKLIEHMKLATVGGEIVEEYADSSMTNSDRLFLSRLTGYIENNIDSSELVVNRLCDFMGVTPLVLNKKLKSLVNMTANNFIRTVRLRRAAMLLRTARYTVSDVTYDVGFSDLRYFRECFRREFGVLPQEYKDQSMGRVEKGGEQHEEVTVEQ